MQDFFISYNKADEQWAMGLRDWLDQAGHTTVFQQQDFVPATNFAAEMHRALQNIKRMIMVLSPDYLSAKFPLAEWTAAFAVDPGCEHGTLIPVRVRECQPDGLLRPIVYIDLVGLSVTDARKAFLDGIASVLNRKRSRASFQPPPAPRKKRRPTLSQSVKGDHTTNVQAERIGNVTIKMTGKKPPSIQPLDVVGGNVEMRAYVEYLIERYIDWRKKGIERGIDTRPFHPSMIHRDIKRRFGARTFIIPQSRFRDLIQYLQDRIDDTIIGRNSPHRNYHSFEEHIEKLQGRKRPGPAEREGTETCSLADAALHVMRSGLSSARNKAQEIKCANNLKEVGLGAREWALNHGGVLPNGFASMAHASGKRKITWCPVDPAMQYEVLSPDVAITDLSVVYARCPIHNNVVLVDGSVHNLGERQLVRENGKWMIK